MQKATASATLNYLYDLAGRPFMEINSAGTWTRGEIYAGNRHLATYANATTYFIHPDWLGTERARSNVSGALCETITSLPFGDGQSTSGACYDMSPLHFTGKERDSESGLDNFGARYDSSSMGRFMSPDPLSRAGLPLDTHDPQSWNAYAYARNKPVNLTDPDGTNYLVCEQHGKNCAALTDKQYKQFRKDNPNLRVTPSGDIYTINPNGTETKTGSESHYNEKDKQAAGQIGQFAGPIEFLGLAEFAILGPYAGPALLGAAPEIGLGGLGLGAGGLAIGKMGDLNAPDALNPGEYISLVRGCSIRAAPRAIGSKTPACCASR